MPKRTHEMTGREAIEYTRGKEVADALDTFLAEYDKTTTSSKRSNQEI